MAKTRKEVVEQLINKSQSTPLWDSKAEQNERNEKIDSSIANLISKLKFTYSETTEFIKNTPEWSMTHKSMQSIRERVFDKAESQLYSLTKANTSVNSYEDMAVFMKLSGDNQSFPVVMDTMVGAIK